MVHGVRVVYFKNILYLKSTCVGSGNMLVFGPGLLSTTGRVHSFTIYSRKN